MTLSLSQVQGPLQRASGVGTSSLKAQVLISSRGLEIPPPTRGQVGPPGLWAGAGGALRGGPFPRGRDSPRALPRGTGSCGSQNCPFKGIGFPRFAWNLEKCGGLALDPEPPGSWFLMFGLPLTLLSGQGLAPQSS